MVLRHPLLAVWFLAGVLLPARTASACEGARLGADGGAPPEPWRAALEALVASTKAPGAPWSCVPATVWVEVEDAGATLVVQPRDGAHMRRPVDAPNDVVPLGQALLAVPLAPAPPIAQIPPPEPAAPERPLATPASPREPPPRVLVAALVTPRYAGKTGLFWLGAGLDAAIPFGAWSVGGWGRVDAIRLDHSDPGTDLDEGCVGLSVGRDFALGHVGARASVRPSLAVVSAENGPSTDGQTEVFGRIGAELRLLIPFTRALRGVVALDGELSPSVLDTPRSGSRGGDAADPDANPAIPFPGYTVGLGLGVELAIR